MVPPVPAYCEPLLTPVTVVIADCIQIFRRGAYVPNEAVDHANFGLSPGHQDDAHPYPQQSVNPVCDFMIRRSDAFSITVAKKINEEALSKVYVGLGNRSGTAS